jgi:hypothetical protein
MLFVKTNTPDMFVAEQRRDYTAFADAKQCVFLGSHHQGSLKPCPTLPLLMLSLSASIGPI